MNKNQIHVFANDEFGEIRTVEINSEVWFVGKDVAAILGYEATRNALKIHVDAEDKLTHRISASGQSRSVIIINESGLYSLILSSKLPSAKSFKRWVTSEVLPSIRQHGGYITAHLLEALDESEENCKTFFEALSQEQKARRKDRREFNKNIKAIKEENELLESYVEMVEPKVEYHDIILDCENAIPVTIIAKDYGMSPTAFNRLLRDVKIQYKVGGCFENSGTWVLYQRYVNHGFTETKTFRKAGKQIVHTYWTAAGRRMIYDVLKSHGVFPLCEQRCGCGLC